MIRPHFKDYSSISVIFHPNALKFWFKACLYSGQVYKKFKLNVVNNGVRMTGLGAKENGMIGMTNLQNT